MNIYIYIKLYLEKNIIYIYSRLHGNEKILFTSPLTLVIEISLFFFFLFNILLVLNFEDNNYN